MPQPRCKHYSPKKPEGKENCVNCYKWIDIQCLDHLTLIKEFQTKWKFAELDRMMRHDSYVRSSGGIRQTRHGS